MTQVIDPAKARPAVTAPAPPGTRICRSCRHPKPLRDFYLINADGDRPEHDRYCTGCRLSYHKRWRDRDPEAWRRYHLEYRAGRLLDALGDDARLAVLDWPDPDAEVPRAAPDAPGRAVQDALVGGKLARVVTEVDAATGQRRRTVALTETGRRALARLARPRRGGA